jgi:hypothetical protein
MGSQEELAKEQGRDTTRFGRDSTAEKDDSFWNKILSRDPTTTDRFSPARFMPFPEEMQILPEGLSGDKPGAGQLLAGPTRSLEMTPGFESLAPSDPSLVRQTDEQNGMTPGYPQLQDPSAPPRSNLRNFSKPDENRSTRYAAPDRPADLQWGKRPGEPF